MRRPKDRTAEDVAIIFNDIMQLKTMFHLSASIRRQLAQCVEYVRSEKEGTVCTLLLFGCVCMGSGPLM